MATLHYKPNFIFSDPGLVTRASKVRVAGAFAFLLLGAFLFGVVLTQVGFCQIHSLLTSSTFDPGFDIQPEWKQQVLSVVLDQHKGDFVFLVWIVSKHFIFSGTSIGYKTLLQVMKCSSIYEVNCSGSHLLDAIFTLYITYQSIQDLYLFNLSIPIVPQEDSQKLQSVLKFHLIICCWFLRLNS